MAKYKIEIDMCSTGYDHVLYYRKKLFSSWKVIDSYISEMPYGNKVISWQVHYGVKDKHVHFWRKKRFY